ncbi:MAG: ABC transporter substrate-binding protein [Pirellulaceae bacterium]
MKNVVHFAKSWLMFLALAAGLPGCGCNHQPSPPKTLEKVEILIDWEAAPTYVGVYYALDSGQFAKAGYDVTIVETWGANQAANAVASGKYDLSTCAGGATVLAIDQEKPIVSTAVICPKITTVIYGLASNGITKPEDLKGKRLGMYAGSITVNEFQAFAKLHSLDRSEIKETIISGGDIPPLKSGVLDAVLNYQEQSPTLLSLDKTVPEVKGQRVNSISLADAGVKGYGLNVIAGKKALAKNPEKVAALTKALVDGYRAACEKPDEAVDSFMKRFPNRDRAFVRAGWEVMRKHVGDTQSIGNQTAEGWDDTVALYRSLGLLKRDFSGADVMKQP